MYTPIQTQIIRDTISGSNTQTFKETNVLYKKKHLRIHTKMVYWSILLSDFNFTVEEHIGTNADIK